MEETKKKKKSWRDNKILFIITIIATISNLIIIIKR